MLVKEHAKFPGKVQFEMYDFEFEVSDSDFLLPMPEFGNLVLSEKPLDYKLRVGQYLVRVQILRAQLINEFISAETFQNSLRVLQQVLLPEDLRQFVGVHAAGK